MWENLGIPETTKNIQRQLVNCVAVSLVLLSIVGLMMLKVVDRNFQDNNIQFDFTFICDENKVYDKDVAFAKLLGTEDVNPKYDDMHCFCQ